MTKRFIPGIQDRFNIQKSTSVIFNRRKAKKKKKKKKDHLNRHKKGI